MNRRVVITGMGGLTPLALDLEESWKKLISGESGITKITRFDASGLKCQVAGEIKSFDPKNFLPAKDVGRTDPIVHYLLAAARMALADGRYEVNPQEAYRVGIVVSSAVGSCNTFEANHRLVINGQLRKVSPGLIINISANTAAGALATMCGAKGCHHFLQEACAGGTNAIGIGFQKIRYAEADVMLVGGTDAGICKSLLASLDNLKALAEPRWNSEPERASRPFDKNRSGFVTAEGAGVLILEELDHALSRNAKIYAEVKGYGSTCDAYHPVAPLPSGESAMRCMEIAIRDAGITPEQIEFINAHGTATVANDLTETIAVKKLFGDHAKKLILSANKSMTGHMWGAAGAIEGVFTAKTLQTGIIPPTINLEEEDPECNLDYTPLRARKADITTALSNSFGFGGINGSIVMQKFDPRV